MLIANQLAWIIAFVSAIISAIRGGFPNFAWWTLVFMFFCIVGVTVTVASDAERTYHVAVRHSFTHTRKRSC
jgi:SHO1 osmosensor